MVGEAWGGGRAAAWRLPGQACRLMFLVLSVAIVPAGPETELNRASVPPWAGQPAQWHPTRAAGRRGPTLPVPTVSVPRGRGRGRGSQDKCPSMSPRGRLPSWGRRWEKGEQCWGLAHSCASAPLLPTSSPPRAGAVRRATLAVLLFLEQAKHILASPQGLHSYCSLSQSCPSHRPFPSLVPCFTCL